MARALIRIGALVPITLRRAWRLRAVNPSSLQSRQMRLMPDGSPSWREPHKPPPYGDCRQSVGRQVNARIHRQAPAGQWIAIGIAALGPGLPDQFGLPRIFQRTVT